MCVGPEKKAGIADNYQGNTNVSPCLMKFAKVLESQSQIVAKVYCDGCQKEQSEIFVVCWQAIQNCAKNNLCTQITKFCVRNVDSMLKYMLIMSRKSIETSPKYQKNQMLLD